MNSEFARMLYDFSYCEQRGIPDEALRAAFAPDLSQRSEFRLQPTVDPALPPEYVINLAYGNSGGPAGAFEINEKNASSQADRKFDSRAIQSETLGRLIVHNSDGSRHSKLAHLGK